MRRLLRAPQRLIQVLVFLTMSVALSARAEETSVDVGGVSLKFATIPGWCFFPPDFQHVTLDMLKALRSNAVYLAVFGDCSQINDALAGGARVRSFGTLIVDEENLHADADIGRDEIISAIAADLPNLDFATQWESLNQMIDQEMQAPKVDSLNILAMIAKDSWSPYMLGIGLFNTPSESISLLSVSSITVVKRRIVMCTVYTDYTGKQSVDLALGSVRQHLARLIGMNP